MNRVAISLVVITALSAALYFGAKQAQRWKSSSVQQAVEQEQERWMVDVEKLKGEVKDLREELHSDTTMETHEQKVSEVLGTPEGIAPSASGEAAGCSDSEKRLISFFDYLGKKYPSDQAPQARFQSALTRLASNPPEIVEKDLDTLALFRNIAHLYRTLGAKDIMAFKGFLDKEPDAVEAFLPDLYKVMTDSTCHQVVPAACTPKVETLYATYFLPTLAGRSYLLRRSSRYRILATYYAVRVLHRADQSGTNIYGVDVPQALEGLQSDIALYKGLARQKEYLATLEEISASYRNR